MRARALTYLNFAVAASAFALAFWAWERLPPHARIPSHWNIHGQVDSYMDKTPGLFLIPAIMAGLAVLFALQFSLLPLRARLDAKGRAVLLSSWGFVLVVLAAAQWLIISSALR